MVAAFKTSTAEAVNKLAAQELTTSPDEYIKERVAAGIEWYRIQGAKAKAKYLWMRCAAVIGGATVPIMANIPALPRQTLVITGISLLVVLCVSLEGVLHYKETWRTYSATSSALEHEFFAMKMGAPPYNTMSVSDGSNQALLNLFGQRVEEIINKEVNR